VTKKLPKKANVVRLATLWNQTAEDDLKKVQEAILKRSQLYEKTCKVGEKCSDAVREIAKGIKVGDFVAVKDEMKGYLPAMLDYHKKIEEVLQSHKRLEKSWLFHMASFKMKIRDLEQMQKIQAGELLVLCNSIAPGSV
jgi:hypothetical protein